MLKLKFFDSQQDPFLRDTRVSNGTISLELVLMPTSLPSPLPYAPKVSTCMLHLKFRYRPVLVIVPVDRARGHIHVAHNNLSEIIQTMICRVWFQG